MFRLTSVSMAVLLGAASLLNTTAARAQTNEEGARRAARQFGAALTTADASALRAVLPAHGKVRVDLQRLGPEDGMFGSGQVEAVFKDFLATGSVRSFEVIRLDSDGKSSALARASAGITDREGRSCRVAIHLAFQPEDGRWVLREVKESRE